MSLSTDDVRHVARLARLALSDDEVEALRPQLSEILAYAEKVGEVATEDVPPTGHPFPLRNVFREDMPREPLLHAAALSAAPQAEDGRFRVPRIVADPRNVEEARGVSSADGLTREARSADPRNEEA